MIGQVTYTLMVLSEDSYARISALDAELDCLSHDAESIGHTFFEGCRINLFKLCGCAASDRDVDRIVLDFARTLAHTSRLN